MEVATISLRRLILGSPSFPGGAYLAMVPAGSDPISNAIDPERLAVPLSFSQWPPDWRYRPLVKPGQVVQAGTPVARTEEADMPVLHAPRAGRVLGVYPADTAWARGVDAMRIEAIRSSSWDIAFQLDARAALNEPPAGGDADLDDDRQDALDLWSLKKVERLDAESLANLADACGIWHDAARGIGLGAAIRQAAAVGVRRVVINGLQPEPFCTSEPRVLKELLQPVAAAALAVFEAVKARKLHLVVDTTDRALLRASREAVLGTPIRITPMINKYPQAAEVLLAWTLAGIETPPAASPIGSGVLVLLPQTLAALWRALRRRTPDTHRVVAVTGPAAEKPGHYRIPIGTRYAEVIEAVGLRTSLTRLVEGGPLTGRSVETLDAMVTHATSTILLIDGDHDILAMPGTCIRCGACQEDCPVGIDPQRILEAHELGWSKQAAALWPQACIECGLCSYVCPSELPLAHAAISLKRNLAST